MPMGTNHGLTESEVSAYQGTNGKDYHQLLKYRPSTGGWRPWERLACDPNILPMNAWDATIVSQTEWYSTLGASTGGC